MEETETITVSVRYHVDAEIDGVSGSQRSGPFGSKAAAESAANVLLSRANVRKATIVREVIE